MVQTVNQTYEEKMAMYMKLSKKEIVKMLIECNKHLDNQLRVETSNANNALVVECDVCKCHPSMIIKTQFGTFCPEHARYS